MSGGMVHALFGGFPDDTSNKRELLRACVAEFLAMALFVFLGTGSVAATGEFLRDGTGTSIKSNVSRLLPIATCFGISITVLAFNFGHISGGHINPAVTLALTLEKKVSPTRMGLYWLCQFLGAVAGSLLMWGGISGVSWHPPLGMNTTGFIPGVTLIPAVGYPPYGLGANSLDPLITPANGLLLETMGTMILVITVLMTAVDGRSMGKNVTLAPLPIGFSVWLIHLVLIPWTGCGINPARTFGPMMTNLLGGQNTFGSTGYIYYLGPVFGAVLGWLITTFLRDEAHSRKQKAKVDHEEKDDDDEEEQAAAAPTANNKDAEQQRMPEEDFDQVYTI